MTRTVFLAWGIWLVMLLLIAFMSGCAVEPLPRDVPVADLAATALNDRAVGGIRCHGLIVALPVVHLVG